MVTLDELPDEFHIGLFNILPPGDLINLRRVSKSWYNWINPCVFKRFTIDQTFLRRKNFGLKLLSKFGPLIKYIKVKVDDPSIIPTLGQYCFRARGLEYTSENNLGPPNEKILLDLLASLNKITCLKVKANLDIDTAGKMVPYIKDLVTLELGGERHMHIEFDEVLKHLFCPKLRRISVHTTDFSAGELVSWSTEHFPRLTDMHVTYKEEGCEDGFSLGLKLPQLKLIYISCTREDPWATFMGTFTNLPPFKDPDEIEGVVSSIATLWDGGELKPSLKALLPYFRHFEVDMGSFRSKHAMELLLQLHKLPELHYECRCSNLPSPLPQVDFRATKLSLNTINRIPNDYFLWLSQRFAELEELTLFLPSTTDDLLTLQCSYPRLKKIYTNHDHTLQFWNCLVTVAPNLTHIFAKNPAVPSQYYSESEESSDLCAECSDGTDEGAGMGTLFDQAPSHDDGELTRSPWDLVSFDELIRLFPKIIVSTFVYPRPLVFDAPDE